MLDAYATEIIWTLSQDISASEIYSLSWRPSTINCLPKMGAPLNRISPQLARGLDTANCMDDATRKERQYRTLNPYREN